MQKEDQIIEAVINVSEGRRPDIIHDIVHLINRPSAVQVVHTDIGYDVNRTVLTVIGKSELLFEAIDRLVAYAKTRLDISTQEGIHPRLGMIDVIPVVALQHMSHDELIDMSKEKFLNLAEKHDLPILYYGDLDQQEGRALFHLRKWNMDKALGSELMANAGPQRPHPRLGVSCATVRRLMTAFNINLATQDMELTRQIVSDLKVLRRDESSLAKLDTKDVRYLAWYMPKFKCCQVSTNIYDVEAVTMTALYDHVATIAEKYDVTLAGSELIGLAAEKAITSSGSIDEAIARLGLDSVKPFDPDTMILDRILDKLSL